MWIIENTLPNLQKKNAKYNLLKAKQSSYRPVVAQRVPRFHEKGTGWF